MDINFRYHSYKKCWIAEVWQKSEEADRSIVYSEDKYTEMNEWCKNTFKYHARTAYHIFEFKNRSDLDWFMLRWG